MSFILTIIGSFFGSYKLFGFTVAQIIAWLQTPQGQQAVQVATGVIRQLQQNGASELEAGAKFLAMVAKVHKMTPTEEEIWMNRASNAGPSA